MAAVLAQHVHHDRSLAAYAAAEKKHSYCAAHTLAEVYATLTRLPGKHRLSGEQALLFVDDILEKLIPVSLDGAEYRDALADSARGGIVGGATYDALIAKCALKSKASTIYTWNAEDFRRLSPEIARKVRTP